MGQGFQGLGGDLRHIRTAGRFRFATDIRQQDSPLLAVRAAQHQSDGQPFHALAQRVRYLVLPGRDPIYV